MRVLSFVLLTIIFGSSISYVTGFDPVAVISVIGFLSFVPLNIPENCLAVLAGDHTGAVSYANTINVPVKRVLVFGTAAAIATLLATKLTIAQATKKITGTICPEMTLSNMADIAGFIDALIWKSATVLKFSIPISLIGAYDLEGGSLTYNLTNCTVGDVIKIYAIDDLKRSFDYMDITPIRCDAGGVKTIDCTNAKFAFVDPTNITRVKVSYPGSLGSREWVGEEIAEICRVVNPVHSVTDAGVVVPGYGTLGGINLIDAETMDLTLTAAGTVFIYKHLLAEKI